jgi:hypothetical protein
VAADDFKESHRHFIGHPHFDRISDAATIAKQTGAMVIGAAAGGEVLSKGGLPGPRFRAVRGGEVLQYPGVTVEAVLGHHNVIATTVPEGFLEKQQAALQAAALQPPLSDAESQRAEAIRAREPRLEHRDGRRDQLSLHARQWLPDHVCRQPWAVTDSQRALMQKTSSVDVAMLPYVNFEAGIRRSWTSSERSSPARSSWASRRCGDHAVGVELPAGMRFAARRRPRGRWTCSIERPCASTRRPKRWWLADN